ncbi:hypothetical protein KC968_04680 [Candidatus Saccharibacteria bacterium]|nr:hypothetical protein [Candidatus Saccharibacteria bacterium]
MVLEFMQYFEAGKHAMELAIVQALPGVFTTAFGMITSGDINQSVAGLLMLLGITLMLWRGVWKIVARVFSRRIIDII